MTIVFNLERNRMNDAEYREKAELIYHQIEETIDRLAEEQDAELDYENSSGVLTLFLEETNTQVIVSRQLATHEIWVAAKSGGFHCSYQNDTWLCSKTNETLTDLLSRTCSEQSSIKIDFPDFN